MNTLNTAHKYSVQVNAHGNYIVCKGHEVRNSYRIVWTTDNYQDAKAYRTR